MNDGGSSYCNKQEREINWYDPEYRRYCLDEDDAEKCPFRDPWDTGYENGECPHHGERDLTSYCKITNETVYDDYDCKYRCKSCSTYIGNGGLYTGCFITTACVEHKKLSDDCYELNVLRTYRDNYLKSFAEGRKDVEIYYKIAPLIVRKINASKDANDIYEEIYKDLIVTCVNFIEHEKYKEAYMTYKKYVMYLYEKFCK